MTISLSKVDVLLVGHVHMEGLLVEGEIDDNDWSSHVLKNRERALNLMCK